MYLKHHTRQIQSDLAQYCRTGHQVELPGTNSIGLQQYRRLVFNIINDSLQSAYPLTYELLTENEWRMLVTEFFNNHACQSPQVWTMPSEFYEYLIENNYAIIQKYPFLPDLLEMEWLEVEVFMMEDIPVDYEQGNKLLPDKKLVLNPEHRIAHFSYPVHLKNASQISEDDRGNFFLLMHREPETSKVIFTDLSIFFARLTEILAGQPCSYKELASLTSSGFNLKPNEKIEREVANFVSRAIDSQLILGFAD